MILNVCDIMKFKKIMLITLVLLAVITMGAVSAIDDADFNETLTVDTAEEVSADAPLDENVCKSSDDDEVVAAEQSEDVISGGNSTSGIDINPGFDSNSTRMNPGMHVNVNDTEFGEPVEIGISFDHPESGTVDLCLDNSSSYTVGFSGGRCTLSLPNLNVGTHQLEAYYAGDLSYTEARVITTFNVISSGNHTGIDINPGFDSNSTRMDPGMHVTVEDTEFGEPVEVEITFHFARNGIVNICLDNDTNFTVELDTQGRCTLSLPSQNVGTHRLEVYYPGDLYYTDDRVTVSFNVFSDENSTGGDDDEIRVGFWDENDERGALYTDSKGWVVNVDVMDGSEGTILVIVNDEEFSWDIQLDAGEDFPYHEWSLEDLNIAQVGDYAVTVKRDDEIIANGTLHVSAFNNDAFRLYINYENENFRLFCPENSTGTAEIIIEREDDDGDLYRVNNDTYEIMGEDYVIWYKENLGIEDGVLYRLTITVTNFIGDEVYRVSQWFSFGEGDEEGFINYHGTDMVDDADGLSQGYSEIITYDNEMWKTDNYFSFMDCDGDKTIKIYINDDQEWDFPEDNPYYTCNLYDLNEDGNFYILPVGDLNLGIGEHYVHVDYGGDWKELIITLYEPQIAQDGNNTIEINPAKTIIKEDDCFVTIANYVSNQVTVVIDNARTVEIPIEELRRENERYIIGSRDLGIHEEGSHSIRVSYGGLEVEGTIQPISNVEIMIQTPLFEDSVVIGYGHDMKMISIFLRDGNVRDIDGAVAVYLNDDETPALIIPDISGLEYDSDGNCYWIYHSQFGATTETKNVTAVYCNGSEADVSNDREVNFTMMTPEYVAQFTEIEIRENVYSSKLAPVTIRFNGNPQSQAGVFDSKYVLYVNGKKIDREYIIFYPKGEGAWDDNRIILDPNDPEVAELMNDDSLEFDVFNWLSIKYIHWACDGELEIAVDELNMTSEGTYNITIKFTGAADGADELELVSQNVRYEIDPNYAYVDIGDEVKYRNDVPFLFDFEFAEGMYSESNRILIYINDVLAFNGTTLYYDEKEMKLVELMRVTVTMLNESLFNEYGFLDVGEYEAAVYLIKGDNATPVELGRNNFTVFKQKGNFTFELITEEDRHTYLYVDVPEGNWEDYSLTINIGDSEEIYPEPTEYGWINAPEGWVERYFPDYEGGWAGWITWFNEYCIFENDQIVLKEPLENIIGKGRVAIDLGILANNTHVFVAFNYGREPYFGLEYDCFNDEFTVTSDIPSEKEDPFIDVTIYDTTYGENVIIYIFTPYDATGTVNVTVNDRTYSAEIENETAFVSIAGLEAGNYTAFIAYSGDEKYNSKLLEKTFTVAEPAKIDPEITVTINNTIYGEDVVITINAPSDATGTVNVNVAGNIDTVALVNGKATVSIPGLETGYYIAFITYPGDERYNSKAISEAFAVSESAKVDPVIGVTIYNTTYGENVNIAIFAPADATGTVNITVDIETYSAEIENGTAYVSIPGLKAGYYVAFITYSGDEKYNNKAIYETFTVAESAKIDPEITVTINNTTYGENVVITINTPADATGNVDITVNGAIHTVGIINGTATATISGLKAGNYTAFIAYSGDKTYNSKEVYEPFIVAEPAKIDPEITVTINNATYGEDVVITINAPADATGMISVTVDNRNYSATLNRTATIIVPDLNAGNYTAFIVYSGDEKYNSKLLEKTFTIAEPAKIGPEITVTINNTTYGENVVVTINAPADATGMISVTVDNRNFSATLNRTSTIIVPDLNAGSYEVLVYYSGDGKYNSYSTMADATVAKAASSITVNDAVFDYGQLAVVPVTVDGAAGVNASVIDYPDVEISYSNDNIIISGLAAGNYTLKVTTIPDNNHVAAVADAKITVNRISSTVSLADIVFDYGESGTSTVNLTGALSFNAMVIEHVEGNVVVVGNAITVSGLDAGTYTLKVTTVPDANHIAAEATAKITVNKVNSAISIGNATIDYGTDAVIPVRADGISSLNASVAGYPDAAISYSDDNTIIISGLNAGTYVLNVVAVPDKNHYASQDSATITVNKISSTVSLTDIVFDYGKSGTSTATLIGVSDIAAEVVGHDEANVRINGNTITVSGLDADTYTLKVTATPDANHIAAEATAKITVNKVDSVIAVDDAAFRYGESAVVPVSVQGADSINASLVGYPDAAIDYVNDEIVISGLGVGNYTLKVTAIPDKNHKAVEANARITVNRVIVTSANFNEYFNENGELIGDFPELIFAGEFADKQFNINKAVALIGENAKFTNVRFNIRSDNVSIRNMELKYQGANSIIDVSRVSNFTLENNNIEYGTAAIKASAISVSDSDDVNIKDNYIKASGTIFVDGILISNSNFTIDSNTISANSGMDAEGINIIGSGNGNVKNNNVNVIANKTVYGINTTVIYQLNIIFVFNVIYGEGIFAVGINDDSEIIGNNKVTLKAVQATGVIVNSENAEVTNNNIKLISADPSPEDPTLESTATGVQVNTKSTVSYNTIDSFDKSVSVDGGCASEVSYNTVNAPVTVSAVGTSLVGNDIETDKDKAIIISEKAVDTVVDNNVLTANGANGDNAISNEGTGTTISNNKAKLQLAIDPISDIFEGQGVVIVITADKNFTGNVTVQVANKNTTASLINGTGKVDVAAGQLSVGEVLVKVVFGGNDKYANDTVNTTFTVKAKTATEIKASAVTTTYGTSKSIVITLSDANGNALAGKQVTVVLNGASKTLTTDAKGQASYAIGTALAVKKYDVTFTFNGDISYAKSTVTIKVTVDKANAKLTAKKKTFKAKKKTKKYTVTLKTDKGQALKKVKVTLTGKFKGKKIKITVKTNSKGKATFNLKKLTKKGKFTAEVKFGGNQNYKAVAKKVKITVK